VCIYEWYNILGVWILIVSLSRSILWSHSKTNHYKICLPQTLKLINMLYLSCLICKVQKSCCGFMRLHAEDYFFGVYKSLKRHEEVSVPVEK